MVRILVSSCLAGVKCNYKGEDHYRNTVAVLKEIPQVLLFFYCPEAVLLPIPREPANIMAGTGTEVLSGESSVQTHSGRDVSSEFIEGARSMLRYAQNNRIEVAFLKELSPSCGVKGLYDGASWPKKKIIHGRGVAAQLLMNHGISVMSDEDEEGLWSLLKRKGIMISSSLTVETT